MRAIQRGVMYLFLVGQKQLLPQASGKPERPFEMVSLVSPRLEAAAASDQQEKDTLLPFELRAHREFN